MTNILNKIKNQDGMIFPEDLRELDAKSKNIDIYVNVKLKGRYGDRGVVKMTTRQALNGELLLDGEFISQVWSK